MCENTIGAYKCGGVTGDPVNLSTTTQSPIEERCPTGFKFGLKGECEGNVIFYHLSQPGPYLHVFFIYTFLRDLWDAIVRIYQSHRNNLCLNNLKEVSSNKMLMPSDRQTSTPAKIS